MNKEKEKEKLLINIAPADYLYVQSSLLVRLNETLVLITPDGGIEIHMEINTDLKEVPEKYREVVLNMITSKYLNKVSFSDNLFSMCREIPKTYWWEFWKWKIFEVKQ